MKAETTKHAQKLDVSKQYCILLDVSRATLKCLDGWMVLGGSPEKFRVAEKQV